MTPAPPRSGTPLAPTGLAGLVLVLLAVPGCTPEPDASPGGSAAGEGVPRVVASIFPVGDLLESLAGETAAVSVLLPPGVSPAVFQPTPAQMRRVAGSSLYVEVGGGLDAWLRPVAGQGGAVRVVSVTAGLELRGEGHDPGSGNPHVWLDPIRVRDHVLPLLIDALADVAPEAEARIRTRGRALTDSLTTLHEEVASLLAPYRGAAFVASHGAWIYFAERYGLRDLGAIHPRPGSEPSSRGLAALVDSARSHGVAAVFAEPQLGETAARALAAELGVPIRILDPIGGPGVEGRDGYLALIRYNAQALTEALTPTTERETP